MRNSTAAIWITIVLALFLAAPVMAESVEIGSAQDNTMFEESGSLSNGAGNHFFAGVTAQGFNRRGLIAFDVAGNVPAGVTITGATLTLSMSMNIADPHDVTLHRVLAGWGEAGSHADGQEGAGIQAESGDATWTHTFFPDSFWTAPGGDMVETPSATTEVGFMDFYSWSDAGMVADLQDWLDNGDNFGWAVIGNESQAITAKRFDAREVEDPANAPVLLIEYEVGDDGGDDGGAVPASSNLGLALLVMLLLIGGTILRLRFRPAATR